MRFDLIPWTCRLAMMAGYALLAAGLGLLAARFPVLLAIGALFGIARALRGRPAARDTHGTARLGELLDAARAGLLGSSGLILGRADLLATPRPAAAVAALFNPRIGPRTACRVAASLGRRRRGSPDLLRLASFVHLSAFAPAGKGKGVSLLIPNLLAYPGNCVVTDPKGELFEKTAAHRRRRLGHRVVRFDPFALGGEGADRFNPLDFIDETAPGFLDDCRALANLLVVRTGQEHEPHWNDSAEVILAAFIVFVCACEPRGPSRTLMTVRALIANRSAYDRSLAIMKATSGFQGVVARLGHALSCYEDRELSSLLSTVQRHIQFLDSPKVAEHLRSGPFDPRDLRSGERITVYLCIPHHLLNVLAPLQRIWIGSILRLATRDRVDERNPVLFLLDEAAHLGRCQSLEDAVTLMRGMGIRLWFFWQSLGQLQQCYGSERAQTFLDNMDTQVYFGTNAFETADALARRIGERTIAVSSHDRSSSRSRPLAGAFGGPKDPGSASSSSSRSTSYQGRQVLKPEEILCLASHVALVFHRNLPVLATRLVRYYDDPAFRRGRAGGGRRLGLRTMARAAALLLFGLGVAAAGALARASDARPPLRTWSAYLPPAWLEALRPSPADRVEALRRARIEAAVREASERAAEGERLAARRHYVPTRLRAGTIRARLAEAIESINADAERQLRELPPAVPVPSPPEPPRGSLTSLPRS